MRRRTQYKALVLEFQRRRHHSIGKTGNGHNRACACLAGDLVKHTDTGKHRRCNDQHRRGGQAHLPLPQSYALKQCIQQLPQQTNTTAEQKRFHRVQQLWRIGAGLVRHFAVITLTDTQKITSSLLFIETSRLYP